MNTASCLIVLAGLLGPLALIASETTESTPPQVAAAGASCGNPLKSQAYRLGEGPTAHKNRLRNNKWQDINSVDYLAPAGTPVYAIVPSTVCKTCVLGKTEQEKKDPFSLNSVTVYGQDGQEYYFTHLATIVVKPGQAVAAGQQVGTIGAYRGKNAHLHLAIKTRPVCDILKKCTPTDSRPCR